MPDRSNSAAIIGAAQHGVRFAVVAIALGGANLIIASPPDLSDRFVVFNLQRGEERPETFEQIADLARARSPIGPRIGVGVIISYFAAPREQNLQRLRECLRWADQYDIPVVVQLDGEQWWSARPDLWNWWDAERPGFDPANVANVEWSGWGPEHALKIAWRNWGRQIRTPPPPNLMSPRYRAECREEMQPLLEEIVRWNRSLGRKQTDRLIGVKVGWESSIGVNAYYYPNGNALVGADPADDPIQPVRAEVIPSRGFQSIGYAAVTTAQLATGGELQEQHVAEVIQRHLVDLASQVRQAGLPREQVFVHGGGWADGELLYRAAINEQSCPAWSFYALAADPSRDRTAMAALADSDAPYWAAAEWYDRSARSADDWCEAIRATLRIDRCRFVGIYNWRDIARNATAQAGIRKVVQNATE